ncbi:MAG TPA: glycosyltransferase [Chitinophagaceae bacterium]|nr:glycosyltransferase [Chitinophagaceae bacterium]
MKLLWLPGWYPGKTDPYNGDFVQRHAQAVALENEVQVIYVVRDVKGVITKDVHMDDSITGKLKEKIIYYYSPTYASRLLDKYFSNRIYKRLYKQAIANYIKREGSPVVVNVHIAMKAGMIARWVYKKWKIPYVISEQWTAYLEEAKMNYSQWPYYFTSRWKKAMKDAKGFSVVSDYLGKAIGKIIPGFNYTVIPNVVNTDIFKTSSKMNAGITRFIHISGLDYQKNPEDILKALAIVNSKGIKAELIIVGPQRPALENISNELGLEKSVQFTSEMPQPELVKWIQGSDALILYSRYETFGCVIIEALACGKPVLLSDLPVMHENVREGADAVFAKPEDPRALAQVMNWFINYKEDFDASAISSRAAQQYNFHKVGRQFSAWYKTVLSGL